MSAAAESCRVLLFSSVRDAVGQAEMDWPLARPASIGSIVDELCILHPALGSLRPSLLLAINLEYVKPDAMVVPGDEIALMPPVQGG